MITKPNIFSATWLCALAAAGKTTAARNNANLPIMNLKLANCAFDIAVGTLITCD